MARLLLLVPVCAGLADGPDVGTTVLLAVWAATDWFDGALARRPGQTSRAGEILDPIADRLGITVVAVTMVLTGLLPWWLPVLVLLVDAVVLVLAGRSAAGGDLRVSRLGKARTALMFTGIVGLAAADVAAATAVETVSGMVLGAGLVLHVVAGVGYVRQARRPAAASI